jgi:hypothetical protein
VGFGIARRYPRNPAGISLFLRALRVSRLRAARGQAVFSVSKEVRGRRLGCSEAKTQRSRNSPADGESTPGENPNNLVIPDLIRNPEL